MTHGWSALPGWLCVIARAHVEHLGELEPRAARRLGELLRASTTAVREAVGCERTYVLLFAERPGYAHLHLHVVPRMAWFGEEERAAGVFRFLNVAEDEQVPAEERERLAAQIGAAIRRELGA